MCKRVGIELKESKTVVDLFQKYFSINQNGTMSTYKPGEYPEPCQMEIPNVEIFQVGLFLVVRIYQPRNPRVINFEVGDRCQLKMLSSYKCESLGLVFYAGSFRVLRLC